MTGLLDNKVVVISGVGPALGTTLARRCAEAGADLVLAARTVERLDDVAKQITDTGRRAVAVGTDITDEEQVNNLVEASLEAYGKVDVLINNAFRVPSMKPLANTTFEHIRDAIELTVLGALRLIQGFTPALAEAKGSVVNVNSMVVRHSQTQARRLQDGQVGAAGDVAVAGHRARRARYPGRTPLLPGYIWGGTLKGYFNHQAGKYGTTVDEIYKAGRGQQRPEAAAHRGRGGVGDPVHGERSVQRHHRPGAGRQLRGVQGLMTREDERE